MKESYLKIGFRRINKSTWIKGSFAIRAKGRDVGGWEVLIYNADRNVPPARTEFKFAKEVIRFFKTRPNINVLLDNIHNK